MIQIGGRTNRSRIRTLTSWFCENSQSSWGWPGVTNDAGATHADCRGQSYRTGKIEKLAASRGLNLRESCRESLLARAKGQELKVPYGFRRHGQMALRGILLNVLFKQVKGQPYS